MRTSTSPKQPHDLERDEAEQEVQPMRRRTGEEEEAEIAEEDIEEDLEDRSEDDASDHTMEKLDEDDLAHMQGPDA
jgi:hypothetical protein